MTGPRTTMSRRRALVLAIAVGLLAGSTVGAAAQSEDVEPVGFTGVTTDLGDDCGQGGTYEVIGRGSQTRGYCYQGWLGTSDPRFTGTLTRIVNVDEYADGDFLPDGDVSLWVSTGTYWLENEGGLWQGDATVSVTVDDVREGGEVDFSPLTVTFTGTGDYEGLTAVVWWQPPAIKPPVRGVIFPGSPPPAPPAKTIEFPPAEE